MLTTSEDARAEYDALVIQVASLLMRIAARGRASTTVFGLARKFAEDVTRVAGAEVQRR